MSFQPDVADPRAAEEGLPCLINRVRSPTSPACASSRWRRNGACPRGSSRHCMMPSWPSRGSTGCRLGGAQGVHRLRASQARPVLAQARWVISRFGEAGTPRWRVPGDSELREHFGDHFLSLVPAETIVRTLTGVVSRLREDLVITLETPLRLRARIGGLQLEAAAAADPPHRLTGLRLYPLGERVTDPRTGAPSTRTSGRVPGQAAAVAEEALAELGLPGLVLAGAAAGAARTTGPGGWPHAAGPAWRGQGAEGLLNPDHWFPAYSVTKLITATVVLRFAADGRARPRRPGQRPPAHRPARRRRRHRPGPPHPYRGGGQPGRAVRRAGAGPGHADRAGRGADGPRGTFSYSNGGYALLGQLIADMTGGTYPEAAAGLVLGPLGMSRSSFPASWPATGAVTGYRLADDGSFGPAPAQVCTIPAAGGLWTTGADLVRFGLGWASLLPAALAREALRPQAARDSTGADMGLGWLLNEPKDVCGHAGGGPGAASSLIIRMSTGQPSVALANRLVPVEPVNARLVRPVA